MGQWGAGPGVGMLPCEDQDLFDMPMPPPEGPMFTHILQTLQSQAISEGKVESIGSSNVGVAINPLFKTFLEDAQAESDDELHWDGEGGLDDSPGAIGNQHAALSAQGSPTVSSRPRLDLRELRPRHQESVGVGSRSLKMPVPGAALHLGSSRSARVDLLEALAAKPPQSKARQSEMASPKVNGGVGRHSGYVFSGPATPMLVAATSPSLLSPCPSSSRRVSSGQARPKSRTGTPSDSATPPHTTSSSHRLFDTQPGIDANHANVLMVQAQAHYEADHHVPSADNNSSWSSDSEPSPRLAVRAFSELAANASHEAARKLEPAFDQAADVVVQPHQSLVTDAEPLELLDMLHRQPSRTQRRAPLPTEANTAHELMKLQHDIEEQATAVLSEPLTAQQASGQADDSASVPLELQPMLQRSTDATRARTTDGVAKATADEQAAQLVGQQEHSALSVPDELQDMLHDRPRAALHDPVGCPPAEATADTAPAAADETCSPAGDAPASADDMSSPACDAPASAAEMSSAACGAPASAAEMSSSACGAPASAAEMSSPACDAPASVAEMSSPACGAPASAAEMSSSACDAPASAAEMSSPACDAPASAAEMSSPACDAPASAAEMSSPACEAPASAAETSSPASNAFAAADEVCSPAGDAPASAAETSSPASNAFAAADEVCSPACGAPASAAEMSSPACDARATVGQPEDDPLAEMLMAFAASSNIEVSLDASPKQTDAIAALEELLAASTATPPIQPTRTSAHRQPAPDALADLLEGSCDASSHAAPCAQARQQPARAVPSSPSMESLTAVSADLSSGTDDGDQSYDGAHVGFANKPILQTYVLPEDNGSAQGCLPDAMGALAHTTDEPSQAQLAGQLKAPSNTGPRSLASSSSQLVEPDSSNLNDCSVCDSASSKADDDRCTEAGVFEADAVTAAPAPVSASLHNGSNGQHSQQPSNSVHDAQGTQRPDLKESAGITTARSDVKKPPVHCIIAPAVKVLYPSNLPGMEVTHMEFPVTTFSTLFTWPSTHMKTQRRFEDFVTLHDALAATLPNAFLPARPGAAAHQPSLGNRRAELERYLNRLLMHDALRSSSVLQMFLQDSPDEALGSWQRMWSGVAVARPAITPADAKLIQDRLASLGPVKLTPVECALMQAGATCENMQASLNQLVSTASNLVSNVREVAASYVDFAKCLETLAACEQAGCKVLPSPCNGAPEMLLAPTLKKASDTHMESSSFLADEFAVLQEELQCLNDNQLKLVARQSLLVDYLQLGSRFANQGGFWSMMGGSRVESQLDALQQEYLRLSDQQLKEVPHLCMWMADNLMKMISKISSAQELADLHMNLVWMEMAATLQLG